MLYLLCIIAPPIAVLLTGRPGTAVLNFFLTLLLWLPGMIHAFMVVNEHKSNQRADRMARTMHPR